MSSQNKYLGNLDVLRSVGCKDGYIGNVVTRQRLDAFVDISSTFVVAVESDVAEIRLYKARLQVGNADGCIGYIDAQSVGERLHGSLCGTIDIATGISSIASHRPDRKYVPKNFLMMYQSRRVSSRCLNIRFIFALVL